MRDIPDLEASVIARKADCSWDELFDLAKMGLIELGFNRVQSDQAHPQITDIGLAIVNQAEKEGKY